MKGFYKLKTTLANTFSQDVVTTLSLIDSLINPILLYACEYWGCLKLPKNNPIENLNMMMCKQILGVQKQTTNYGVLLELGKTPLHIQAKKLAIKNWERIRQGKANEILLTSCRENSNTWDLAIKECLEINGLLYFYENSNYNDKSAFAHKRLFQTLCDQFHQNAFAAIQREESKLRTYAIFKTKIGIENYLSKIKNSAVRTQISKFRLSNHRLRIETGRHKNQARECRTCPFCPNCIETEIHFLFYCPVYNQIRERLGKKINEKRLTDEQKLILLLADTDNEIAHYISKTLELREFLLRKHKIHG